MGRNLADELVSVRSLEWLSSHSSLSHVSRVTEVEMACVEMDGRAMVWRETHAETELASTSKQDSWCIASNETNLEWHHVSNDWDPGSIVFAEPRESAVSTVIWIVHVELSLPLEICFRTCGHLPRGLRPLRLGLRET